MTVPPAPEPKPKVWLIVPTVGAAVITIAIIMFVQFGPEAMKAIRETREAAQVRDLEQAKLRISTDIRSLTQACVVYKVQHAGEWPPNLGTLLKQDEMGHGPYLLKDAALRDPWGRDYAYNQAGPRNEGRQPDISCEMPDGRGTIGNWSRSVAKK